MLSLIRGAAPFAAAFVLLSAGAHAHVTLEAQQAPSGSIYKAVLKVPHGCEGSATTAIRVQIPEGVVAAKPMPKPGWDLKTVEGQYAQSYAYFRRTLEAGVKEISWSGGNLPDAWYDEFVFEVKLPEAAPGTIIYFPVVQQCEKGIHRWIEIPETGKNAHDYEEPAPGVKLTTKIGG